MASSETVFFGGGDPRALGHGGVVCLGLLPWNSNHRLRANRDPVRWVVSRTAELYCFVQIAWTMKLPGEESGVCDRAGNVK